MFLSIAKMASAAASLALALGAVPIALAQSAGSVYSINGVTVLGSGCPAGSTFATPSADGQSMTILFTEYGVTTSESTLRARKACNMAVEVHAQPGIAIGFFKIDYRGYAYVPPQSTAYGKLTNEYFFAGQSGAVVTREFYQGFDDDVREINTIDIESVIWSPCGGNTTFRVNSAVQAVKPRGLLDDVLMQIDSADGAVAGELQVYVTSKAC